MAWGDTSPARNELLEVWNRSPAGSIDLAAAWIDVEMPRIDVDPARIEIEASRIDIEKSLLARDR
jgi:hypothetical protein